MDWIIKLFTTTDSVPHIVLLYALVISIGVLLGKVKFWGISLGVTFVLFTGILAGHIGFTAPGAIMDFLRDFGLIFFVFSIGLQVGPGFFESFRKGGVALNALAVGGVFLGIAVMFGCYFIFFDSNNATNLPMMVGTLCGAVTNTPGLGAATEALKTVWTGENVPEIASGYACAYPLGVLGIIASTIAVRYICRVNLKKEEEDIDKLEDENPKAKPCKLYLKIDNKYLDGETLGHVVQFLKRDFVFSRLRRNGEVSIPGQDTIFKMGDEVIVVCAEVDAEAIQAFVGPPIETEWNEVEEANSKLVSKRLLITNSAMNGKTLGKIHFNSVYGVNVTRVSRQGVDLYATRNHHFQLGDKILVVGTEENVNRVERMVGNSARRLNIPNIATIFIGIILGILVGSIPIPIPGIPVPLTLGSAGGPLIVAILIGRFGYRMKLVTYTTTSANMMLRDIGLVLFLASVGIKAGAGFWDTVVVGDGLKYVYTGVLITVIPTLLIGLIARMKYKINYFTISGMLAGISTDPPALAYASQVCPNEEAAVGYSTVYPLVMFFRIFTAQLIILLFCVA